MSVVEQLKTRIGQTQASDWLLVDQARVDGFADLTFDHNFIHIDPARAKVETPFGGTIAHGFLTLSLMSHFAQSTAPEPPKGAVPINYGFDSLRFISPVRVGSRVRGVFTPLDVEERKPGQILLRTQAVAEIEGGHAPALKGEWLTLYLFS
ncbi:MAG: MaoC family dehydratase [Maricaulaceae bacterium]|nr:MaoC family dehydratase [Maricaulaceae bacterium]